MDPVAWHWGRLLFVHVTRMAWACVALSIFDSGARVERMRRVWVTLGCVALAGVAVSCGSDSKSPGCQAPCGESGVEGCYTFGSGESSIVARAKCEYDEEAGCMQWSLVEACNETCEKNVCDPSSSSGQCKFPCSELGVEECHTFASGSSGLVTRAKCEYDEKAGCQRWGVVEVCNGTCEKNVCDPGSEQGQCKDPCGELGAEGCYTFGSGDHTLVARAKCAYDEKAGCMQWEFVEACDETCEENVCDPVPESAECEFSCSEPGAEGCYMYKAGAYGFLARARCSYDAKLGCMQWRLVEKCDKTCEENVCDSAPGACVADCSTAGEKSCRNGDVVECREVAPGCFKKILAEPCDGYCDDGKCMECSTSCTEGSRTCVGYVLKQCKRNSIGCLDWETVKQCEVFCSKEVGSCSEDLPACKLTNGMTASIAQWTDGDTLWLYPESQGMCNEKEYDSQEKKWKNIRWRARIHGIDAPECTKEQNSYFYYTCVRDSVYTNTNEPYGYEAWKWAETKLPFRTEVVLTCDNINWETGACQYDATADDDAEDPSYNRYLVYLGYSEGSASYDFSIEIARRGLAFSNTKFSSSKRDAICRASKEAKDARENIWSLDDTVSGVLGHMGTAKQHGLKNMPSICSW